MLYNINFGTGKLEPIDESTGNKNDLPIGTVLQLEGYNNPKYVITGNRGINPTLASYGASYECVNLTDGGHITKQAYTLEWLREKKSNRIQTYITNKIMTADEMTAAITAAEAVGAENARLAQIAADEKAADKASLPARYPYFTVQDATTKSRILATKNIRIELKRTFPAVKFSVKSECFSGGDSISISWTDGPITEDVDKITRKYQAGDFDGMNDIYNYSSENWPEVFGGAKYVHTGRYESPELIAKAALDYGYKLPTGESDKYGILPGLDWEKSQMIYRHAHEMAG